MTEKQRTNLGSLGGRNSCLRPFSLNRQDAVERLIRPGFPYSRTLTAHSSCVNSLTFSREGRWLASAGDDPYILLWDFHQDDLMAPSHALRGPRANVFALAFSSSGQYLISGDTNCAILKYDLSRLSSLSNEAILPSETLMTHTDSIRAISCHPYLDDVFLSASEDGRIILHDSRCGNRMTRAQATLQEATEFTGLQFHPDAPDIFVTAENTSRVCLRDVRMAFGPASRRSHAGVVQTFVTSVSRPNKAQLARPEASSVTFDRTGSKLAVTFLGHYPTIYTLSDPYPLAVCSGRYSPDGSPIPPGKRTYANSCTMKHGSFGGPGFTNDSYYSAGSDDFCGYVWRIPDTPSLELARERYSSTEWPDVTDTAVIGYTASRNDDRYVPVDLSTPLSKLTGHKSIVNTTLMHPHMPFVLTAGVERHILLHSPTSDAPCAVDMNATPKDVRALPDAADVEDRLLVLTALTAGPGTPTDDDDLGTIALFDEILRQEGNIDIFARRVWNPHEDSLEMGEDGEQMDTDPEEEGS